MKFYYNLLTKFKNSEINIKIGNSFLFIQNFTISFFIVVKMINESYYLLIFINLLMVKKN